jgi:hypothetical protein
VPPGWAPWNRRWLVRPETCAFLISRSEFSTLPVPVSVSVPVPGASGMVMVPAVCGHPACGGVKPPPTKNVATINAGFSIRS